MHQFSRINRRGFAAGLCGRSKRRGFTLTELVVAATLLIAGISVIAPLTVRSGRLWQDSRHQRLAIEELSNQLEFFVTLTHVEREAALAKPEVSSRLKRALPNPVLTAETLEDEDGIRLVLRLNWDRVGPSAPISLVGWLDPLQQTTPSASGEPTP